MQEFLRKEYGQIVAQKIKADALVQKQMKIFEEVQKENATSMLKTYLDEAFDKAITYMPRYVQEVERELRTTYYNTGALALVKTFLDSGIGLFQMPVKILDLTPENQEIYSHEWKRFTRMYACNPAKGREVLTKEMEEMWTKDQKKWPNTCRASHRKKHERNGCRHIYVIF